MPLHVGSEETPSTSVPLPPLQSGGVLFPGWKRCALSCFGCCVFVASSGGISGRFGHIRMCHFFLSSRTAHLHKYTPTRALIPDQTTHQGTPNAQRHVRTEPDAHRRGAHMAVANNMLIFETFLRIFFVVDRRSAAVWWHPDLKAGATLSRQGGCPGGVACILMAAWLIFISVTPPLAAGLRPHGSMGSLPRSFV